MSNNNEVKENILTTLQEDVFKGMRKGAMLGSYITSLPGAVIGGLIGATTEGFNSLVIKPLIKLDKLSKNLK